MRQKVPETMQEEHNQHQWPLVTDLVRGELHAYLAEACSPTVQGLATHCAPWTVRDLTAHLAVTFRRFADMLDQSRAGDLSPPFAREDLTAINLLEVDRFAGDPCKELCVQAERFLNAVTDPDERMSHQRGPVPVALQVLFGLNELALHRHDLEEAVDRAWRPDDAIVDELLPVWELVLGGLPPGKDGWQRILTASGR